MTSSPEPDDLPPALRSMWRVLALGYRNEPWLLVGIAVYGMGLVGTRKEPAPEAIAAAA